MHLGFFCATEDMHVGLLSTIVEVELFEMLSGTGVELTEADLCPRPSFGKMEEISAELEPLRPVDVEGTAIESAAFFSSEIFVAPSAIGPILWPLDKTFAALDRELSGESPLHMPFGIAVLTDATDDVHEE